MDYISECITKITEFKRIIEDCYMTAQLLQKESPHNENLQKLVEHLEQARNFGFNMERRKGLISFSKIKWYKRPEFSAFLTGLSISLLIRLLGDI